MSYKKVGGNKRRLTCSNKLCAQGLLKESIEEIHEDKVNLQELLRNEINNAS